MSKLSGYRISILSASNTVHSSLQQDDAGPKQITMYLNGYDSPKEMLLLDSTS